MATPGAKLALFALLSLIGALSFSSAVAGASPPSKIEYGYQNVPHAGNGGSNSGKSGGGGGQSGSPAAGDSDNSQSRSGTSADSSTKSNEDRGNPGSGNEGGRGGNGGSSKSDSAQRKKLIKAAGVPVREVDKKTPLPISKSGVDGDLGSASPSLLLILSLVAVAGVVGTVTVQRRRNN